MVKSTCQTAEDQTLFLGCSVMSFSISAGINSQVTEVTIQLVEDTCKAEPGKPKKFRDCLLREQDWLDEDPGFFGEQISIIGRPAYFRVGNFEFSGLIQAWERVSDTNTNPVYEVKLIDPRIILENTRIIMNDDTGSEPPNLTNVYNALYWNELQRYDAGAPCSPKTQNANDGVVAGSLAGFYGAADQNNNGLALDDIYWMINSRINSADRNDCLKYLQYSGPYNHPVFGDIYGMGMLDASIGIGGYALDISELPPVGENPGDIPIYYRFDQTEASLMEILNQILEDSGHDYYVELLPCKYNGEEISCEGYDGKDYPYDLIIKLRVIDRKKQVANEGSIKTFVEAESNSGRVISYSEGRELRNDITQTLIYGAQKESIWQVDNTENPGSILPYFGIDPTNGNVVQITYGLDGYFIVNMPSFDLQFQLSHPRYGLSIPDYILISEHEIIMAQEDFDTWHSYASAANTPLYQLLDVNTKGVFNVNAILALLAVVQKNPQNNLRMADFINASSRGFAGHTDGDFEKLNIAFSWINKLATDYYGKQYQVLAPFTCNKISSEAMTFMSTEEPTESGWTDAEDVLAIQNPSEYLDFFRDESYKIVPFVGYNGPIEMSSLSQDTYIADLPTSRAWIKVGQEQEYVYGIKETRYSPRVIISLPQQIRSVRDTSSITAAFSALENLANTVAKQDPQNKLTDEQIQQRYADVLATLGSALGSEGVLGRAIIPTEAAIAIKSNLLRYGPWSLYGLGTVGGDTNIKVEDGLAPWEYSGSDLMNIAATALASEGISKQQIIDKGSVTVHGFPDLPLGAEILAIEDGVLTGSQLYENRPAQARTTFPIRSDLNNSVVTPISLLNGLDRWEGQSGANITSITTRVGSDGTQTTYSMRVYTDKFGRFAQLNAKRLKSIGKWRLALTSYYRSFARRRNAALNKFVIDTALRPAIVFKSRWGNSHTPHEVIVGQIGEWNDGLYQRPIVGQMPMTELAIELSRDYEKKSFMSLDGLIRPISVKGASGELPKFANPLSGCMMSASKGMQPPIDISGEAGQLNQYNLNVSIDYLNPFENPSGVLSSRCDTPNHGHDIELIGRGGSATTGTMMMCPDGFLKHPDPSGEDALEQNDYSEDGDYRAFALRGPLLLQSWGYDLDGFPIPNAVDSDSAAKSGDFESENLQHKFMDNWLRKSETWPVAPVDLRFDRERAVWTVPQYRDVTVDLQEDMNEGSALGRMVDGPTLYDSEGNEILQPELYVTDRVGNTHSSGDRVVARFDPSSCEYYIIEAASAGQEFIAFEVPGYSDQQTVQCWYVRISSSGNPELVESNPPLPLDGEGTTTLYKGRSYDTYTQGEAYHTYLWIFQTCNDDVDIIEWLEYEGGSEIFDWAYNLTSPPGGWTESANTTGCDRDGHITLIEEQLQQPVSPTDYEISDIIELINSDFCDPDYCSEEEQEDERDRSIEVKVIARSCGKTKATLEDEDGMVTVYDTTGSFLSRRDLADAIGRTGHAALMQKGNGSCYWMITWLDWFDQMQVVGDVIVGKNGITIERYKIDVWRKCQLEKEFVEGVDCDDELNNGGQY